MKEIFVLRLYRDMGLRLADVVSILNIFYI